jgi:hypothetical protein
MPKFNAPLDMSRAEVRNAVTQNLTAEPATPIPGLRYYDSLLFQERYWNGTKWVGLRDTFAASDITGLGDLALLDQVTGAEIAPDSITDAHINSAAAIALSKLAVDPLARANHTGTQLAVTISDFDAQVRTNPLDLMAIPLGTVDFGGQALTGLAPPSSASDAANKDYVDSVATGLDVHTACRVATTGNLDLAAPGAAIDGITLTAGDRVLVKDQTNGAQNGIYVFAGAASPLTRASDADADGEIKTGTFAFISGGVDNEGSGWSVTTSGAITIDTTPITWSQFSGGGSNYVGTANRITVTGNQIDIAGTYVGQASLTTLGTITTGVWHGTPIDILYGGTGATTASQARINLGTIGKHTANLGDGTAKTFTIPHTLGTTQVGVELFEASTGQTVYADVRRPDAATVIVDGFVTAPAANALRIVIWG